MLNPSQGGRTRKTWPLSAISNAYPQGPRHQRHAASKLSNIPIVRDFRRFVKSRYYAPKTIQYSAITQQKLVHWHFFDTSLKLFCSLRQKALLRLPVNSLASVPFLINAFMLCSRSHNVSK